MAVSDEGAPAGQTDESGAGSGNEPGKEKKQQREIKGGIPYTVSPGVLKNALDLIIAAERPDKFGANYMETVLKLTGGSARAVPPFLKKMQFLEADGSPTPLYSRFKTDGGRSQAAFDGLKNAFNELFRRNEYIHKADENGVKDKIVEITGLKRNDPIVRLMYNSFEAVRGFITGEPLDSASQPEVEADDKQQASQITSHKAEDDIQLGLSYQINIILPETENIAVFNAIFKSLRDNLLK